MTDFMPAFTDEQLNSMSLQDEIQNMLVDEVRRSYAHIKFLEEENTIIKESSAVLFKQRFKDGERLKICIEALTFYANKNNWREMYMCNPPRPVINETDGGKTAIEALKQIGAGE